MPECCEHGTSRAGRERPHLLIVGGGSAAFAAATRAVELGGQATILNDRLPIGGTCVNVGCVPSKTLIRAAETLERARHSRFDGIETSDRLTDFRRVIEQKRQLVADLRQTKYLNVVADLPQVRLLEGRARFIDSRTVEVNGDRIRGDRVLIATGVSPSVPPIPGIEGLPYLTNESAFELEDVPESLIVLGGRFVGLECAQIFARFGSKVTILQRSARILPTETADLTDALTNFLREEGLEIVTATQIERVRSEESEVVVEANVADAAHAFRAERILVATGRSPNTQGLGLADIGVQLDARGYVRVNDRLETSVSGIYAAGDVIGDPQFVYTAAYEGALAAENALNGSGRRRDYSALPWVIFTDPQICGVGLDEVQAAAQGIDFDVAVLPLAHVPRAIAARDTRGLIKLIRDRTTDRLVGARVLAPEGSELLMEIALAIRFGISVTDLRNCFHPYLTQSEGIKLAAIAFGKDVARLSCCAT